MIRRMVLAAVLLAAAISARADVPDMRGHWQGFSRSVASGDVNPDTQVDIVAQNGHRFEGVFDGGAVDLIFSGIVNRNGVVNLTGTDPSGNTLHAHGYYAPPATGGLYLLTLRFWILDPVGLVVDQGVILLVQMFGGFDWNNDQTNYASAIDGLWAGLIGSTEYFNANAAFAHAPNTTMVTGTFNTEMLSMNIVGTMTPPSVTDGTSNTIMLGVSGDGRVAILIGLLVPAVQGQPKMLVGQFKLWKSFFDVPAELIHDKKTSTAGIYSLSQ